MYLKQFYVRTFQLTSFVQNALDLFRVQLIDFYFVMEGNRSPKNSFFQSFKCEAVIKIVMCAFQCSLFVYNNFIDMFQYV